MALEEYVQRYVHMIGRFFQENTRFSTGRKAAGPSVASRWQASRVQEAGGT